MDKKMDGSLHPNLLLGYNDMIVRGGAGKSHADMRFVQNFTQPDFQAKSFTPSISPNFNSFSDKNTKI